MRNGFKFLNIRCLLLRWQFSLSLDVVKRVNVFLIAMSSIVLHGDNFQSSQLQSVSGLMIYCLFLELFFLKPTILERTLHI